MSPVQSTQTSTDGSLRNKYQGPQPIKMRTWTVRTWSNESSILIKSLWPGRLTPMWATHWGGSDAAQIRLKIVKEIVWILESLSQTSIPFHFLGGSFCGSLCSLSAGHMTLQSHLPTKGGQSRGQTLWNLATVCWSIQPKRWAGLLYMTPWFPESRSEYAPLIDNTIGRQ